MGFDVDYDENTLSIMIRKTDDENWFTPSNITYDVKEYDGFLKDSSINLDIITPVNNFEDYAYTYSKVYIEELDIDTDNSIVGTSFGDSFFNLKEITFPILEEIYKTHEPKALHTYFEDNEGHIKYLLIDLVYKNGDIFIFYNNTTDPLLKSQLNYSPTNSNNSYTYVKDINNAYFWESSIYELIEREKRSTDNKKDILKELVIPKDKYAYNTLIEKNFDEDKIIHIITEKGNKKTLKVKSTNLNIKGILSHTQVNITDISECIEKKDEQVINFLLKKLDAKLGAATVIINTNGDHLISNAIYTVLHIPQESLENLLMNFKKNIINPEDKIDIQNFEDEKINHLEKIIQYKSPNYPKKQHLFTFLEKYEDKTNTIYFMGVKDITTEIEREKEILSQKQELDIVYDTLKDAEDSNKFSIQYHDHEYHWTPGIYDILEQTPQDSDAHENILFNTCDEKTKEELLNKINELGPNELLGNQEIKIKTKNGNIKYLLLNVKKVYNDKGIFIQNSCYCRDVTEEHRNKEEVNLLTQVIKKINTNIGTGAIIYDNVAKFAIITDSAREIFGSENKGDNIKEIEEIIENLVESDKCWDNIWKLYSGEIDKIDSIWDYKFPKTGEIKKLRLQYNELEVDDRELWVAGVIDLTEEIKREEKLIETNENQNLLIRESNHRIKNNLNLLLRLISLEKRFNNNYEEILNNVSGRIDSLAILHEKLYKSENLKEINAVETFQKMVKDICNIYKNIFPEIDFEFMEFDEFKLPSDKIEPLLLILNELLINSFKYAYQDYNIENKKFLGYVKKENKIIECFIKDNGKGYPEDFNPKNSDGLGWIIIESLTKQLDGKFEIYNDNGACFKLKFPLK